MAQSIRARGAQPSAFAQASIQTLEARRFASSSVSTWAGFLDASSDQFFGQVEIGDNGRAGATDTGYTGTYGTSQDENAVVWDTDLSDGLDSDWRPLALDVNVQSSGGVLFVGGDASALTFSAGSGLSLHQVRIAAAVEGSGYEVDLQSLVVGFYHNGTLVEQTSLGNISANSMNATTEDSVGAGATVTTSATNINGVSISGEVRFQGVQGNYPSEGNLQALVAVS